MESLNLQQLQGLFVALIIATIVILVALIVYVVVANRRQRAKMNHAREMDRLVPQPARQVAGQVLSLVRDEPGGELQVEVGGVRYLFLTDIEEAQVRRQVMGAALELIRFTGVLGEDVEAPPPLEETASWREELREDSKAELARIRTAPTGPADHTQSPPAPEEVEEEFLNLLTEMGQAPQPLERTSIAGALQQRRVPKAGELEQPRTFVDDIEDIVQRRVRMIPALLGRDLHIRLGPGDTVRFLFDGQEYENLDDVPNMTARQLVKDAIKEWEETD